MLGLYLSKCSPLGKNVLHVSITNIFILNCALIFFLFVGKNELCINHLTQIIDMIYILIFDRYI